MNTDILAKYFGLDGKVALITGSSRGIGYAIAEGLAGAGAHVVLNSRVEADLVAAERRLVEQGLSASHAVFDVTDQAAVRSAVEAVAAEYGRLDIAIGNAGRTLRKPFAETTAKAWADNNALILDACFYLASAVLPHMERLGEGRIIFTGSQLDRVSRPTTSAYTAAKAAVSGLARGIAVELGRRNITCNVLAPGVIATEMTAPILDPEFLAWVGERAPMGRVGRPEDLVGAVLMLAGPGGGYCNGSVVVVDGGLTINA